MAAGGGYGVTERLHAFCCRSRFKGFITSKNNAYEEKMIREEKTLPFFLEDITSIVEETGWY